MLPFEKISGNYEDMYISFGRRKKKRKGENARSRKNNERLAIPSPSKKQNWLPPVIRAEI